MYSSKKNVIRKLLFIFISLLFVTSLNNAQSSKLITAEIPSPSMVNNKLELPAAQNIAIYLPPSYESTNIKYPVVYFLPGYGDLVQYWTNGNYQNFKLKEAMDRLINQKILKEFIVVIPNGYNFLGGSFYVNSPVTGNCEDFIVSEVVSYIDSNYRTLKTPQSRGISGHSMGGFGALNLAMHHPDVFGSVYCLSPGIFDKQGLSSCQLFKSTAFITQYLQKVQEYSAMNEKDALAGLKNYIQSKFNSGDWDTPFIFAYGAAFSPNTNNNFPFIDYPYSLSGNQLIVDSVKLKNYENGYGGFAEKVTIYKENLLKLHSITIDYGLNDYYRWIPQGCQYFSDLLSSENINHNVVTFNGGHEDQVRKRIEEFLLPAFSKNLIFDTTLTGIKINKVLPKDFELFQNYPNPFNPETTINYQIPVVSHVELKIFDILGREIVTLVDKELNAGTYTVKFDGSNLNSGVYFFRMKASPDELYKDFTQINKMLLMR